MKAYWIRSAERSVEEVDWNGKLQDLQRMAGGYIELAKQWPSEDVLFVDEEGLLHGGTSWFRIAGKDQPICGNGVVLGAEQDEDEDERSTNLDPTITLDQLRAEVTFLTPDQVAAWARANSSEPAVSVHFPGHSEVLTRTGELFGQAPPGKKREG